MNLHPAFVYVLLVVVAGFSLRQSNQAISLGRDIDHEGDIRACEQENLINGASNARNAELEQTARVMVQIIDVLAETAAREETRSKIVALQKKAATVQTEFKPAEIVDCDKIFPGP